MLFLGILGLQALLFLSVMGFCLWMQHQWRNAAARKEEIHRLVDTVAEEDARVEFEAVADYNCGFPLPRQCAVCFSPTTTRCSRCKSVHYCSGRCQIVHWRQGHKDECQPLTAPIQLKPGSESYERAASEKQSDMHGLRSESLVDDSFNGELTSSSTGNFERPEDFVPNETKDTRFAPLKPPDMANSVNGISHSCKINKGRPSNSNKGVDTKADDVQPVKLSRKKSIRRASSSEMLVTDHASDFRSSTSSSSSKLDAVTNDGEETSRLFRGKDARSRSFHGSGCHSQDVNSGLRRSVWRKVQQLKAPKQLDNYKFIFPYELFVRLYSYTEDLCPFGLLNCGNSCYANAVIQCLVFTRPFTSYLVRGLHSNTCRKKDWCFTCELEVLIFKAREGESLLSPIGILSKIQNIGSHLGHGREEDAHEFLRYAVDTMQSVCLKEPGLVGPLAEETTLVGLTFGGYLRSKITCMRCQGKSERFERIMDLTVEIDGNIGTLEEALKQFTADEILDGENKYNCSRCKSYVKAKKKLRVLEAPNVLTIVLKRFQSGNLGKLTKSVKFPEGLDMAPYMCRRNDRSPEYSLYAVVVHRDLMNSTSSGHYVCYVKNSHGEWFGINDCSVIPVEQERVLCEEAYMLLYARHRPEPPALLGNNLVPHGERSKKRNLEAVPSSLNTSKTRSNSNIPSKDPSKSQQKHGSRYPPDNSVHLNDPDDWRFCQVQRVHPLDSSSESSSLFSSSDASSCSTSSTKDSVKGDDLSDFLFGEGGPNYYSSYGVSSNQDAYIQRKKDEWWQSHSGHV